jgi:hypothetical protein
MFQIDRNFLATKSRGSGGPSAMKRERSKRMSSIAANDYCKSGAIQIGT